MILDCFFGKIQLAGNFRNGLTFQAIHPEHRLCFGGEFPHTLLQGLHQLVVFDLSKRALFFHGDEFLILFQTLAAGKLLTDIGEGLILDRDLKVSRKVFNAEIAAPLPQAQKDILHNLLTGGVRLEFRRSRHVRHFPVPVEKHFKGPLIITGDQR